MASFDPSVISQIPDMAGNPQEARAKAFKLADLMTQEQSNRILLADQKQQQADQAKAKEIYQKHGDKVGTTEGNLALAGDLAKAGLVKQSREAYQFGSEQQVRDLQQQEGKIKLLQYASDVIGPEAMQIKQVLQTQGLPMAQAMYQKRIAEILPQLPEGAQHKFPPQLPNDPAQAAQLLDGAINASAQARQMLTQQRQQAAETEKERHDRAMERHAMSMEGLSEKRLDLAAQKEGPRASADDTKKIQAIRAYMADRGLSFPSGMRSKAAQEQTLKGLLQEHPNDSPEQIAQRLREGALGLKTATTEAGVVARREGQAAPAINALNRQGGLYDQVLETGKRVDMGSSKMANAFRLWKQGEAIADPDLSEYVNTLVDTRAEFASVLARGGQVTDAVRIASEHAFPDKMSYPELQRNVERSKKIAEAIQAGNTSVADAIIKGKTMDEAMKAGGSAPAASQSAGPKPYSDAAKEQRYQEWKRQHGGG